MRAARASGVPSRSKFPTGTLDLLLTSESEAETRKTHKVTLGRPPDAVELTSESEAETGNEMGKKRVESIAQRLHRSAHTVGLETTGQNEALQALQQAADQGHHTSPQTTDQKAHASSHITGPVPHITPQTIGHLSHTSAQTTDQVPYTLDQTTGPLSQSAHQTSDAISHSSSKIRDCRPEDYESIIADTKQKLREMVSKPKKIKAADKLSNVDDIFQAIIQRSFSETESDSVA